MASVSMQLVGAVGPRVVDLWRAGPIAAAAGASAVFAALMVRHFRAVRREVATQKISAIHSSDDASAPDVPASVASPPVILLGGEANALSVARDLGRQGVTVYALLEAFSSVPFSRFCRRIGPERADDYEQAWADFLLSEQAKPYHGAVLLACSDAGILVLLRHREALQRLYRLDLCNPTAQMIMLDKLETYRCATAAGVVTPRFWAARTVEQIEAIRDELVYPLLVKPRLSHVFDNRYGRKHIIVEGYDELLEAFKLATADGMEALLVELIPGGDDHLCSYFTYIDERGTPLVHFTKAVIRRYPAGMGGATYHITRWIPELIAPSNRLLDQAGLRGLANIEFKLDPRDRQYKLIECNARFAASNALVSAAGVKLAELVYNRITNRPPPAMPRTGRTLRQWDPIRDFSAFRELRRMGQITFGQWLRSVAHPQTFQFFEWRDPMPAVARLLKPIRRRISTYLQKRRRFNADIQDTAS